MKQVVAIQHRKFTDEETQIVCDMYAADLSKDEVKVFLAICSHLGLDPVRRQVFPVKRFSKKLQREVIAVQTSAEGYRSMAEQTGEYQGQLGPQWCGPDAIWKDVWLKDEPPAAARVGIMRKGWKDPMWGIALWKSSVQRNRDGSLTEFWFKRGPDQLAKCAEVAGFRKAFPQRGWLEAVEMGPEDIDEATVIHEGDPETGELAPTTGEGAAVNDAAATGAGDAPSPPLDLLEGDTRPGVIVPPAPPPIASDPALAAVAVEDFGWVPTAPQFSETMQREEFVAFCRDVEKEVGKPGTIIRTNTIGVAVFVAARILKMQYPQEEGKVGKAVWSENRAHDDQLIPVAEMQQLRSKVEEALRQLKGK